MRPGNGVPKPTTDVLIVGGGPAGSVTGLLLARAGFRVDLIDRAHFPRPKPCGEFVNPGALRLLQRIGLYRAIAAVSQNAITGWHLHTDGAPPARGQYGRRAWGVGISRGEFDLHLLDAARQAGVRVREGVVARRVASCPVVVTVRTAGGALENEHPRILVGADGLNSIVSRTLGGLIRAPKTPKLSLSAHVRGSGPDRSSGYMYVSEGLTVGLAATGTRDDWNATVVVKPGNDGREVAAGPTEFLLSRLASARLPWTTAPTLADGPWASGPFDRPVGRISGADFVLVGDASGYFDPLTGQGIYRALRSAELAAPRIAEALARPQQARAVLSSYERALTRDRRAGRAVQKGIERVMASRHARRWTLGRLAARHAALDALLRVTGDVEPISSLARPSAWLPTLPRSA